MMNPNEVEPTPAVWLHVISTNKSKSTIHQGGLCYILVVQSDMSLGKGIKVLPAWW